MVESAPWMVLAQFHQRFSQQLHQHQVLCGVFQVHYQLLQSEIMYFHELATACAKVETHEYHTVNHG